MATLLHHATNAFEKVLKQMPQTFSKAFVGEKVFGARGQRSIVNDTSCN
jgi:hypothetical protein